MKTLSEQEQKKQQELQEWLDKVHFGSCCTDPLVCLEENKFAQDEAKKPTNK